MNLGFRKYNGVKDINLENYNQQVEEYMFFFRMNLGKKVKEEFWSLLIFN